MALLLREWLPSVLQAVEPFVSSDDLQKGARWFEDLSGQLTDAAFGIVCLTRENRNEPWINYEAGAIANKVDRANVTAFLVDLPPTDITGPLAFFQATEPTSGDIKKLLITLNSKLDPDERLTEQRVHKAFEKWWPDLESGLRKAEKDRGTDQEQPIRSDRDLLQEVLELTRYLATKTSGSFLPPFMRGYDRLFERLLTERERKIIYLRYGVDGGERRTHEEIGLLLGISAEGVKSVEQKALEKLREELPADRFWSWTP